MNVWIILGLAVAFLLGVFTGILVALPVGYRAGLRFAAHLLSHPIPVVKEVP